jgi:hypothetical protein
MAIVRLNNDPKLNIDTSQAKGLEKVIGLIAAFVLKAQNRTTIIFYGNGQKSPNRFRNSLNRGIIYVLKELSSVDFCNIINYTLNNVKLGDKSFNPKKPPGQNASEAEIRKWAVQKKAYDFQKTIDKYYGQFGSTSNVESNLGLLNLVKSINLAIDNLLDAKNGLNDPNLVKSFPEIYLISNYLNNTKAQINSYVQTSVIPENEVQKLLVTVGKIREVLIAIQAINTPAALIGSIDSFSGGAIQESLAKINRLIDAPGRLIPRLKDLLKLVNNIASVARSIAGFINLAKTIVTIALLLIRVFNIIKAFFVTLPIPGLLTTLGLTTFAGKTYQQVLEEQGTKKLITRLSQMNLVLTIMSSFVTNLLAAIDQVLIILRSILLNLQSCNNVDEDLLGELDNTIKNLEDASVPLRKFINDVNTAQERSQKTFGEYSIEIVQEQIVDEGISLRRRYGIARNSRNEIVVESSPTFASLDLIIINEVKVLLVSKGLVKSGIQDLSSEELSIVMESMNFLGETDITLDNIQSANSIDLSSIDLDNDSGLGINSFVDNLPGGRALRKKVRKKLISNNEKLSANLKSSDPNSSYTQNITKQTEDQTKKLKIQDLTEEREKLQKALIGAAINPAASVVIIKKIKDIDEQLKQLKNS